MQVYILITRDISHSMSSVNTFLQDYLRFLILETLKHILFWQNYQHFSANNKIKNCETLNILLKQNEEN